MRSRRRSRKILKGGMIGGGSALFVPHPVKSPEAIFEICQNVQEFVGKLVDSTAKDVTTHTKKTDLFDISVRCEVDNRETLLTTSYSGDLSKRMVQLQMNKGNVFIDNLSAIMVSAFSRFPFFIGYTTKGWMKRNLTFGEHYHRGIFTEKGLVGVVFIRRAMISEPCHLHMATEIIQCNSFEETHTALNELIRGENVSFKAKMTGYDLLGDLIAVKLRDTYYLIAKTSVVSTFKDALKEASGYNWKENFTIHPKKTMLAKLLEDSNNDNNEVLSSGHTFLQCILLSMTLLPLIARELTYSAGTMSDKLSDELGIASDAIKMGQRGRNEKKYKKAERDFGQFSE